MRLLTLSLFLSGCTLNLESNALDDLRARVMRLETHAEAQDQDMKTAAQKFQLEEQQIQQLRMQLKPAASPTPVPGK